MTVKILWDYFKILISFDSKISILLNCFQDSQRTFTAFFRDPTVVLVDVRSSLTIFRNIKAEWTE